MGALKERRAVDVDCVIAHLRAIDHTTVWERTMAVGRVVFEGVFAGDVVEWRARRGNKSTSLRKLVGHPECPFKKSALSVAVNVYLFAQERPEVCDLANIPPSHVSAVCSLPPLTAFGLLATASSEGWTIRDLVDNVRSTRREFGERRGRPCSAVHQRAETMGRRSLRALERMQAMLDQQDHLDETTRLRLVDVLEGIAKTCARIRSSPQLRTHLPMFTPARPAPASPVIDATSDEREVVGAA
jgi:hypothetical protein